MKSQCHFTLAANVKVQQHGKYCIHVNHKEIKYRKLYFLKQFLLLLLSHVKVSVRDNIITNLVSWFHEYKLAAIYYTISSYSIFTQHMLNKACANNQLLLLLWIVVSA